MGQGKMRLGVCAILGLITFLAIGQPVSSLKQIRATALPKMPLPEAEAEKQLFIQRLPDKVFAAPYPKRLPYAIGSFPSIEGNSVHSAFEVVLVQDMSFGDFRVGTGEGGISLSPSGAIQIHGSIAVLDRRMRPAVFQITTDSVRLLEVQLPDVFYLQSREGAEPLAVRPITVYGSGRFLMELRPRPEVNMLRIGGELTILSPATKAPSGEFSAAFRIAFIPVH